MSRLLTRTVFCISLACGLVHPLQADNSLMAAAKSGNLEQAQAAISAGEDVNARDENRYTAAHWAARRGDAALLDLLYNHGANLGAENDRGRKPWELAEMFGHYEMAANIKTLAPYKPGAATQNPPAASRSTPATHTNTMPPATAARPGPTTTVPLTPHTPAERQVMAMRPENCGLVESHFQRAADYALRKQHWRSIRFVQPEEVTAIREYRNFDIHAVLRYDRQNQYISLVFTGDRDGPDKWARSIRKLLAKYYRKECRRALRDVQ